MAHFLSLFFYLLGYVLIVFVISDMIRKGLRNTTRLPYRYLYGSFSTLSFGISFIFLGSYESAFSYFLMALIILILSAIFKYWK